MTNPFEQIVFKELKAITLNTINTDNLGSDLLETDVDKYLALRGEVPAEMNRNAKYARVAALLGELLGKKGRKSAVDKHYLDMAKEARLVAERAAKEKELETLVRQAASPLCLKTEVKRLRTATKDLGEYQDKTVKDKIAQAKQVKDKRQAIERKEATLKKIDKIATKALDKLDDKEYALKLGETLAPLFQKLAAIFPDASAAHSGQMNAASSTETVATLEEDNNSVSKTPSNSEISEAINQVEKVEEKANEALETVDEAIIGKQSIEQLNQDLKRIQTLRNKKIQEQQSVTLTL